MGTNEFSHPAFKSSWESQNFGVVSMVLKMAQSTRPQWVNCMLGIGRFYSLDSVPSMRCDEESMDYWITFS